MSKQKVYQKLAGRFSAYLNCIKENNEEWEQNHKDSIETITNVCLPSGPGIDSGNSFDFNKSKQNKLVINSSWHIMNQNGYYDGWIDFTVTITPDLISELNIDIRGNFGKKHQDLKSYLSDLYYSALTE